MSHSVPAKAKHVIEYPLNSAAFGVWKEKDSTRHRLHRYFVRILVAVTTLDAIVLIVPRLEGVQQPYVSTNSGKNKAPLSSTTSSYLRSFSCSPVSAAEPAAFALLATNFNRTVLRMIESAYALQVRKPLIELSTQQLVSCDQTSAVAMETEVRYPYLSGTDNQTRSCSFNHTRIHASITGLFHITMSTQPTADDENDMMVYLYPKGPITACLNAVNLQFYLHTDLESINLGFPIGLREIREVTIGGFEVSDGGTPFWIVRNSWRDNWGDGGYFLIERNVNMFGIAKTAFAAYITH
ncbi:cathepsin L-like [Corticium candelabrum]|uniref:cathepsin L-like n=1 Tax=Corticium candelabrum TaxID=121492 RepID=UPI002E26D00B|nr:cathepsin L-like [Corticium candelabrum]